MDEFEFIEDCCRQWETIPPARRKREQQWVMDVVTTIDTVENEGLAGFWAKRAVESDRLLESLRVTGNREMATILSQSRFLAFPAIDGGTPVRERKLSEAERARSHRLLFQFIDLAEAARESLVALVPKDVPLLENGEDPDPGQPTLTLEVTESIRCPYCGQAMELVIDTSIPQQNSTTDCEVCCRPFEVTLTCTPGEVIRVDIEA